MKNMHKKVIILIICVAVGVLLGFAIYYLVHKLNKTPNVPKETTIITNEQIGKLLEDNYLISYILLGDINTEEGYLKVEDTKYYIANDEKLKDIKSMADIATLINGNILEEKTIDLYQKLISEGYNNYADNSENLYVKKRNNECEIEKLDSDSISYEKIDDNTVNIKYNKKSIKAYKVDDNWYTDSLGFDCK